MAIPHIAHISQPDALDQAAAHIQRGEIVAIAFNGVYGLFGNIDDPEAAAQIFVSKDRPLNKSLIAVIDPESITMLADAQSTALQVYHPLANIQELLRRSHALGVILPAGRLLRHISSYMERFW